MLRLQFQLESSRCRSAIECKKEEDEDETAERVGAINNTDGEEDDAVVGYEADHKHQMDAFEKVILLQIKILFPPAYRDQSAKIGTNT